MGSATKTPGLVLSGTNVAIKWAQDLVMRKSNIKNLFNKYRKPTVVILTLIALGIIFSTINYVIVGQYIKYITNSSDIKGSPVVGVVMGGGIKDDKPRPLLKDRLDISAKLLNDGKVRMLLVSGDNRFVHYNEPKVMKEYLVKEKNIKPELIQEDYAGRSTYETCERAKKIYGLNKAVFISESTHLPRVMYLCRSFGIETYGVASDGRSSAGLRVGQRFREFQARTKAVLNVYVIGERTILGDKIQL